MENSSKQIFEQMADRYDTEDRIKIAEITADAIRSVIIEGNKKTAVDYGCGTGLVGLNLINSFQSVLFADASPQMIEKVRQKIKTAQISTANTMCFDLCTETPDLKTDYIFLSLVLLHIKDVPLILSKLFDLLNDGGHLIIVDFDKEESIVSDKVHNGFNQPELRELIKQTGFREVDSHTFYFGEKIFMNTDASLFILDAEK